MENFLAVARQVWTLFALMGAGVALRRFRLVDEAAVKGIVNVLVLAVTPCLIVSVFQRPFDTSMVRQLAIAFAVSAAVHAAMIAAAHAAVRRTAAVGDAAVPVLRMSVVFSNAGFMGIPLEQAVLGERGVFFGIVYVAVFNVFMWSWGLKAMTGAAATAADRRRALRTMLVNPGTVGLAVGLPLFLFSVRLPDAVARPVGMMAAMNTPLAMIVIGWYLAGARLGAVAKSAPAHLAAVLRLVACPLLLVAALYPARGALDRTMMLALVTAASAPVAAMTAMFAAKYGRDVDLAVGLVSGTTLLSMATMPAVIAFAMAVL